jgi:hypothetical protein
MNSRRFIPSPRPRSLRASIVAGMASAWGSSVRAVAIPLQALEAFYPGGRTASQKGDHLLDEGIAVSMARARRPAETTLAHAQAGCKHTAMAMYNAC